MANHVSGAFPSNVPGRDFVTGVKGNIGQFDVAYTTESQHKVKSKPVATGNVRYNQPVQSTPPQRQRTYEQIPRTKLQNTSVKLLNHLLSMDQNFSKFNKLADRLKMGAGWERALQSQMHRISDKGLLLLAGKKEVDMRGYDRELMHHILQGVKSEIANRKLLSPEDLSKLEAKIKGLETHVLYVNEKEMKKLGGGAVNIVYSVKFIEPETGREVEAVFKPDPADLDAFTLFKEQHFGTATASGIPPGLEAHLPNRAVASSVVDRLLYGDNTISVKTQFVIINGKRGVLMAKATGKSPKVRGTFEERIDLNKHPKIRKFVLNQMAHQGKLTTADLKFIAASLKYRKIKFQEGAHGKWVLTGTTAQFEQFDPFNATTAEGLIKLQVKDIITGECDRHPENYFVDDLGNVTGIDEDCCFGVNSMPEGVDVRKQESLKAVIPNNASLMLRMPPVVTQSIKNQIDKLYANKDQLTLSLQPYVSSDEIKATLRRLEKLHEHVNNEFKCLVVKTSQDLLSEQSMIRIDTNNSYWARELLVYSKDEKGWNYLREHRIY